MIPKSLLRIILAATIVLAIVGCDQSTKHLARSSLQSRGTVRVIGELFVLRYAENQGAFLGLGSGWHPLARALLFGAFSLLIVVAAAVYVIRERRMSPVRAVALSLIVGGGLGNLIDRLARGGCVTDFMNVGIGAVRTGIFNFADVFLMLGALLLLLVRARRSAR